MSSESMFANLLGQAEVNRQSGAHNQRNILRNTSDYSYDTLSSSGQQERPRDYYQQQQHRRQVSSPHQSYRGLNERDLYQQPGFPQPRDYQHSEGIMNSSRHSASHGYPMEPVAYPTPYAYHNNYRPHQYEEPIPYMQHQPVMNGMMPATHYSYHQPTGFANYAQPPQHSPVELQQLQQQLHRIQQQISPPPAQAPNTGTLGSVDKPPVVTPVVNSELVEFGKALSNITADLKAGMKRQHKEASKFESDSNNDSLSDKLSEQLRRAMEYFDNAKKNNDSANKDSVKNVPVKIVSDDGGDENAKDLDKEKDDIIIAELPAPVIIQTPKERAIDSALNSM